MEFLNTNPETEELKEIAVLAAADLGEYDVDESLDELRELAYAAEIEVVASTSQKLQKPIAATYLGSGKLEELKQLIALKNANLVIFDDELSGMQLRNIEKAVGVPVIDRTTLILDIFARRARSSEGKLQVELARQEYRLPRLVGLGESLSRQQGGIGSRGAGESKLEYDRRHIRSRITTLKAQLGELSRRRQRTRDRRRKDDIPSIAIIGYTNVGKSTLLNQLTEAGVLEQDMLFATLDPTARIIKLPNGQSAALIDTVGLIRRLPHKLVEAFHSTLEEAAEADLIIELCDLSAPNLESQKDVTTELLRELSCGDTPKITVYNKCDKLDSVPAELKDCIMISAKTGEGLDRLLNEAADKLSDRIKTLEMLIPFTDGAFLDSVRRNGKIFSEEYTADGIKVKAAVEKRIYQSALEYKL